MKNRTYPHCDRSVLHSPGTCDTCDQYASDLQEIRKAWNIAFTAAKQFKDWVEAEHSDDLAQ